MSNNNSMDIDDNSSQSSAPIEKNSIFYPVLLGIFTIGVLIMSIAGLMKIVENQTAGLLEQDRINVPPTFNTALEEQSDIKLVSLSLQESLSSSIAAVRPSVVYIAAQIPESKKYVDTTPNDPTFSNTVADSSTRTSAGSGIIVDSRGYIVTNYHVIADALSVNVTLFGPESITYPAVIISQIEKDDLAVLKITINRELPYAKLGNSQMIEVGDIVLAIGSPFGLEQTVTMGIISDEKRNLIIDGRLYEDLIQTDAAINSGNSGGPLVNIHGEVIGINTAIYAPTGTFAGVGFAIPINKVKQLFMEVTN